MAIKLPIECCIYVVASTSLVLALAAATISFISPFWLGNVTSPWPGQQTQKTEHDLRYIHGNTSELPSTVSWRGLWAQCSRFPVACQWFWQYDYSLQQLKLTPLGWHLATQIFYTVGFVQLIVCEVYVRVQLCCGGKQNAAYRALGVVLFVSFVLQAASVCVFGAFASDYYGVNGLDSHKFTYLGWSYWLALTASIVTLTAGTLFTVIGWIVSSARVIPGY